MSFRQLDRSIEYEQSTYYTLYDSLLWGEGKGDAPKLLIPLSISSFGTRHGGWGSSYKWHARTRENYTQPETTAIFDPERGKKMAKDNRSLNSVKGQGKKPHLS